mgnify:CR=1 FL=1
MQSHECNTGYDQCATGSDLSGTVSRMCCACAAGPTTLGAPLPRELLRRVECDGEGLAEDAHALGPGPGDGACFLAGLHQMWLWFLWPSCWPSRPRVIPASTLLELQR